MHNSSSNTEQERRQGLAARISRRRWLGRVAATTVFSIVPRHVLGGPNYQAPSSKLNIAGVGLGAMGLSTLQHCESENVVALCDVDWQTAAVAFQQYPDAAKYQDYRELFDQQRDIDAVVVSTPDHTHAVITAKAMRRGKHVYTQMPLAHDVAEVRQLVEIARETGVTTQMGNCRHSGPDIRSACEWIWAGVLGAVREVHCWSNRPQWPQGMTRPKSGPPIPSTLDWNGWIGPAAMRDYHPAYHPYLWRGWQDFGTGALGAVGCDILDAPFWALKLEEADHFTVEAESTEMNDETWPKAATIRYTFPARADMPPVTIIWNDGGRRPPRPDGWPQAREHVGSNGTFFIGENHTMAFGALVGGTSDGQAGPRLVPDLVGASPPQIIPRVGDGKSRSRHEQEWIQACKEGRQPCSSFDCAGPLTEMVLLGNVALLADQLIEWDCKKNEDRRPTGDKPIPPPRLSQWLEPVVAHSRLRSRTTRCRDHRAAAPGALAH